MRVGVGRHTLKSVKRSRDEQGIGARDIFLLEANEEDREEGRRRWQRKRGEGEGEKGETYIEKAWLCERRRGEHNRVLLESSKPTERKVEAETEGESRRTLKKREAIALRTGKRRA